MQAWKALHESEARLRALIESIDDVVFELDADGTCLNVWAGNKAILARPKDEVIGRKVPEILGPDFAPFVEIFKRVLASGRSEEVEYSLDLPGGRRCFLARINPIPSAEGSFKTVCVLVRDTTERKRAEEELRLTQFSVEHASDAVFWMNPEGQIVYANEAACRSLGRSREELLSLSIPDIDPLYPRDGWEAVWKETKRRGSMTIETQHRSKQGRVFPVEVSAKYLEFGGKEFSVTSVRDITERKRTEEALRKLSRAVEQSPASVVITDPQGNIEYVNPKFTRLTGYTREEVLGKNPRILKSEMTPAATYRELWETILSGGEWRGEFANKKKNGELYWESASISPIKDAKGAITHFVAVKEDITERKRAEDALRESEYWLKESQQISQIGTYVLDVKSGVFLTVSETLEEILGAGPDYPRTVEGWKGLMHPDQREELMEYFTHKVLEQRKPFDLEYRIVRPSDGQVRWVHGRGALICDSSGQLTTMAGTLQDITARKAVEEQLQQAQKLESLGRLAGGVAHDFNNLLTIINGYSALLLGDLKDGDPLRQPVTEIHKAGEHAANLTGQLLSFSRKQIAHPEPVDLNQLIGDNVGMLQRLVGEDIQLEIQLVPSLGIIQADPGQLHQVLMNLAVNARDAMPRGGRITITTAHADVAEGDSAQHPGIAPGRHVVLSVSDTGTGIEAEVQKHIFDPFFTTKDKGEGTGLGLATVYGIVRQAGGSISVHSEVGHGATFLIYLPRSEATLPASETCAPASGAPGGKETVLVVEDMEPVRNLAARILRRYGYRILEAAQGDEALRITESYSEPIHLLLTDVIMPGMTGPELAQRLKTMRPALQVLYMSGCAADVITHRGLLEPGQLHIAKPFAPEELALKVREALGSAPALTTGRVLVVDDESQVRAFFQKVLTDAGYEVLFAKDGNQALKMVCAHPFDLVLVDLVMPEGEGIETIQAMRKEQPSLKIIAVSGFLGGEFLKVARHLGANFTIAKPVDPVILVSAVRDLLGQSHGRR
jgi:PAS domain S-box-containing protein